MQFSACKKNTIGVMSALFLFVAAALLASACSARSNGAAMEEEVVYATDSVSEVAVSGTTRRALAAKAAAPTFMAMDAVADAGAGSAGSGAAVATDASGGGVERKLIRNASVSLEVKNLEEALSSVETLATSLGGYISNSNASRTSVHVTLRVPADAFDEAVSGAEAVGSLLSKSVSVDDVSEEYYDLFTRLETRKVLHEKLSGYLKQAEKVEDLLSIERQLNNVQSEIESMEGRLRRLTDQIDLCTVSVSLSLPSYSEPNTRGFVFPNLTGKLRETVSTILDFFSSLAMLLVIVIVCGVPLVLALAFLFWLSFGKVGLVKKLFAKVRGEK